MRRVGCRVVRPSIAPYLVLTSDLNQTQAETPTIAIPRNGCRLASYCSRTHIWYPRLAPGGQTASHPMIISG